MQIGRRLIYAQHVRDIETVVYLGDKSKNIEIRAKNPL